MKTILNSQKGQVVLILILITTVALGIGLSVVSRSLSDVSTATKAELSSRAFSAAEAGIEDRLRGGHQGTIALSNSGSEVSVDGGDLIPCVPGKTSCDKDVSKRQAALEFPPLGREEIAQVWLADPEAPLPGCSIPGKDYECYTKDTLDVYWGDPASTDYAALELILVHNEAGEYKSKKWFLDNSSAVRNPDNRFEKVSCSTVESPDGSTSSYRCKKVLGGPGPEKLPSGMILLRARLLYNTTAQPFAVQTGKDCSGKGCFLPPQAKKIDAVGKAGNVQRKVSLFQEFLIVPSYFDYGIFSAGEITK